jgi:predicted dehydrogenase
MIQVGTGGRGETWCKETIPPNVADGSIEVVAAVDVEDSAHENAIEHLDLDPEDCYTDAREAFEAVPADFCGLAVPPQFREELVSAALEYDLDIVAEKPIADTLDGAARIADQVEAADGKMALTMTHRYRPDITTMRRLLAEGEFGELDYLSLRYVANARSYGWQLYDWESQPMLIDGSIHHLDLLAAMADADCEQVYARSWNPDHSEFSGDPNALVTLTFADGTHATYEGVNTSAVTQNGWHNEYVRAECSDATAILDGGVLRVFPFEEGTEECVTHASFEDGAVVPLDERDKWKNAWLLKQFVDWLDGGEPMATNVHANLESMAIVFAAIESAETDQAVRVDRVLEDACSDTE